MPNRRSNGPKAPRHPGELLLALVEKHHVKQIELAKWLGVSFPRLNLILHGKRSITPDTALRLERIFGKRAEFWLDAQAAYEIDQVKRSPKGRAIARIPRHPELRK